MQKYVQIYIDAFGFDETDYIPSELGGEAVDIHHVHRKGSGGDPKGSLDRIENLIAVTREQHDYYGEKVEYKSDLYQEHMKYMESNNVEFDKDWILEQIAKYKALADLKELFN